MFKCSTLILEIAAKERKQNVLAIPIELSSMKYSSLKKPNVQRLIAIDHLRGLIMILMALDHTRDFFSHSHFNPLDLDQTTTGLFLTRWITHFCAPLFILLSGISTELSLSRSHNRASQSRLLFMRGAMLILLELTWVRILGWDFGLDQTSISVGVIWAIGWCMITLSVLVYLPRSVILMFSLTLIAGHNALDAIRPEDFGTLSWIWKILHTGGQIPLWGDQSFHPYYPLIPWLGVMGLGYAIGPLFHQGVIPRQRTLMGIGFLLTLAFFILRWRQGYGDSHVWVAEGPGIRQVLAFLDCTKYPPSLQYLLMTMGPGLLLLALMERALPKRQALLATFGEVPLIFYLLHLPLIHGLAVLWDLGVYGAARWQFNWPINPDHIKPPLDHGFALPGVYLVTGLVIALLYPLCRRYARLKQQRVHPFLRYL